MKPEYQLAIEALQREVAEFERKAEDAKSTANKLCEHAGVAPIYPAMQAPAALGDIPQKAAYSEESRASARPTIRRKRLHVSKVKMSRPSVRPFTLNVMRDGTEWTTGRLKDEAIKQGISGIDNSTPRSVFQGTLLALLHARVVEMTGTGTWRITPLDAQPRRGEIVSIKGAA